LDSSSTETKPQVHMKLEPEEPVVEPTAPPAAQSIRMEGWVKYCEYFHLLDADMQQTSQLSAQRYDVESNLLGGAMARCAVTREHDECFRQILTSIEKHDKPLVLLKAGAASEDRKALEDSKEGTDGKLVLDEADLAMVQARLRAAAHSSNLRAAAAAEVDQAEIAAEVAAALEAVDRPDRKSRAQRAGSASDPGTCAAAIETLLWFGLALGDTPRDREARKGSGSSGRSVRLPEEMLQDMELSASGGADAALLACDWRGAMCAAGLSDEHEAQEALEAVLAVEAAERAKLPLACGAPRIDNMDAVSEFGGSDDSFEPKSEDGSELKSDTQSACGSGDDASESTERRDAEINSFEVRGAARRSRRSARPPRQWTSAEAPLLKWEKEQQRKQPPNTSPQPQQKQQQQLRRKRHVRGLDCIPPPLLSDGSLSTDGSLADSASGDYETDSSCDLNRLSADLRLCSADLSASDLSIDVELFDDVEDDARPFSASKRRHVLML